VNLWDLPASITSSRRFALPDVLENCTPEMTMLKSVKDHLLESDERLADLRSGHVVVGFMLVVSYAF